MKFVPHALYLLGIMWVSYILQSFFGLPIADYGIIPRTLDGLLHIPSAPFIHHSWPHLISNSVPFLILGALIQLNGKDIFWSVFLLITLISGLGIFVFGSDANHAGASGVIFGFWSFLILHGIFSRSFKKILLGLMTLVVYGWMIFSLLDLREEISWSAHAWGMLSGIMVAWWFRSSVKMSKVERS